MAKLLIEGEPISRSLPKERLKAEKAADGWYSPVAYTGSTREKAAAVPTSILSVDIDDPQVLPSLDGLSGLLIETATSTDHARRYRLHVDLAEPLDAERYTEAMLHFCKEHGIAKPDQNAKDISRLWYRRIRRVAKVLEGKPVTIELPEVVPEERKPVHPDRYRDADLLEIAFAMCRLDTDRLNEPGGVGRRHYLAVMSAAKYLAGEDAKELVRAVMQRDGSTYASLYVEEDFEKDWDSAPKDKSAGEYLLGGMMLRSEALAVTHDPALGPLRLNDLSDLTKAEPVDPGTIAYPILPRQEMTLLSGHGGVGKSMLTLTWAVHVACGAVWGDIPFVEGKVLIVSLEDPVDLVRLRLKRICEVLCFDVAKVIGNVTVVDIPDDDSDEDVVLATESNERGVAQLRFTKAMVQVEALAERHDLVIIDNASDAFDGNENNRRLVGKFAKRLKRIAKRNNAAVLLLAHIDKAGVRNGTSGESYSGTTAWHNKSRSRLALLRSEASMGSTRIVELHQEKSNLARGLDEPVLLEIGDYGVPGAMGDAEVAERGEQVKRAVLMATAKAEEAKATVYAAKNGAYTAYRALEDHLPEALQNSKVVNKAIDELLKEGVLQKATYTKSNGTEGQCLTTGCSDLA